MSLLLVGNKGIFQMLDCFVYGYLVAAFILSLLVLLFNKKTLDRMKNWQVLLFFVFLPVLAIREILYNFIKKALDN